MLLSTMLYAVLAGGALAQAPVEGCLEDACKGLFNVGPYKMQFYATQDETGATRFFREIPSFGPTHLNIGFAERVDDGADLRIDVTLYWGKNELKPPLLLDTLHVRGTAPIDFDHDFAEDGKYIAVVDIARPGEAARRGQFIFFVIQTAESGYPVAAFIGAATAIFIYFVWKTRLEKPSPRRWERDRQVGREQRGPPPPVDSRVGVATARETDSLRLGLSDLNGSDFSGGRTSGCR